MPEDQETRQEVLDFRRAMTPALMLHRAILKKQSSRDEEFKTAWICYSLGRLSPHGHKIQILEALQFAKRDLTPELLPGVEDLVSEHLANLECFQQKLDSLIQMVRE
jgi:hypothetical protein